MTTAIQARTRLQIRQAIGYALLGPKFIVSKCTAAGSTTTAADSTLTGGDTDYIGGWFIPSSGTAAGEIVRVSAFDETGGASEGLLTFNALSNSDSVDSGDAYELWPDEWPPAYIHNLIDQAIIDATGITYDAEEDITVHLHPDVIRYDIPTQFAMVNKLETRQHVKELIVDDCEDVWSTVDADVTASADTQIKRRGNASLKLVIAAAVGAGDDLATETINSSGVDMSLYTHLEGWIRCSTTLTADDLNIILSDSGGIEETLSVPAVSTADTWQYFRIAFAAPQDNTAITTIAIDYKVAGGPYTVWFDDIKATRADDWMWTPVNNRDWSVDRSARDIIFKRTPDYALLKISGGDKPALLTTDASTAEIDDSYIIQYATALAMLRAAENGPERSMWALRAEQAKSGLRKYNNVRKIDG